MCHLFCEIFVKQECSFHWPGDDIHSSDCQKCCRKIKPKTLHPETPPHNQQQHLGLEATRLMQAAGVGLGWSPASRSEAGGGIFGGGRVQGGGRLWMGWDCRKLVCGQAQVADCHYNFRLTVTKTTNPTSPDWLRSGFTTSIICQVVKDLYVIAVCPQNLNQLHFFPKSPCTPTASTPTIPPFLLTLGTGAQIPTGYMVKTLRAQSTCDSNVPSDQMLSTFWIYPAMWPQYAQWVHAEYIFNVPSHVTPMYPEGKQMGTFWIFPKIWLRYTQWVKYGHILNIPNAWIKFCPYQNM